MTRPKLEELFGVRKPMIGMVHLAGRTPKEKIIRAVDEVRIYEENGFNGVLVEDYHCKDLSIMHRALKEIVESNPSIPIGLNILQNPLASFAVAVGFGAKFVQLDYVAGSYVGHEEMREDVYSIHRDVAPGIFVFGGVWPKYYTPIKESSLEEDIEKAMGRCEAIVVTGKATGVETPIEKIIKFRGCVGNFPLIVGAGLNGNNAYEQLVISDGAIMGSSIKPNIDTNEKVDPEAVREFADIAEHARDATK